MLLKYIDNFTKRKKKIKREDTVLIISKSIHVYLFFVNVCLYMVDKKNRRVQISLSDLIVFTCYCQY